MSIIDLEPDTRRILLETLDNYLKTDQLQDYRAYPKQMEFHMAGHRYRSRLLKAGNQVGKTTSAGAECAMHLTGEYPDWWRGHRFDRPITLWASGLTGEATRDNPQRVLLGLPRNIGTGMIPKRCLTGRYGLSGATDGLYDYMFVKHVSGGQSMLKFRYYSQGREAWQGPPVNCMWWDEEPDKEIYDEGLARTIAVNGITILTFTPEKGHTELYQMYAADPDPDASGRWVTTMTLYDAGHKTAAEVEAELARWPKYKHRSRIYGEAAIGRGMIYPYDEEEISVDPFPIPDHWPMIAAIDFGGTSDTAHPTACVKIAHDRENDTVYVTEEYRRKSLRPAEHWLALRYWGERLIWAWPRDGIHEEKATGVRIIETYRDEGMRTTREHAHYPAPRKGQGSPGSSTISVERGIMDIDTRLSHGKLKVFSHCSKWFEEQRTYHRDEKDKIHKLHDDLMDATRYAIMMLRHADTQKPVEYRPVHEPDWQVGL